MENINQFLEYTLLKPDTSAKDIRKLCEEAILYQVKGICIPPYHLSLAREIIPQESGIQLVSVVGFPMGYSGIPAKVEEAKRAVDDGADELDMVVNISAIKDKRWGHVHNDIDAVTRATHLKGKILKVIFEIGLLKPEEVKRLVDVCAECGVDYLKTSTGMHNQGPATVEQIKQLRQAAGNSPLKIKASGGIRDREHAEQLIRAGASRIGTSAAIEIIGALKTL